MRNKIRGNVYFEDGVNCYEKISRLKNAPFWGLSPSVLNKLKNDGIPFVIKFIWEGKGGIVLNESDLDLVIKNKEKARSNGDYKIHLSDFNLQIDGKWDNSLLSNI